MKIEKTTTRPKGNKKTALRNLYKVLNTKYGKENYRIIGEVTIFMTSKGLYRGQAEVEIK